MLVAKSIKAYRIILCLNTFKLASSTLKHTQTVEFVKIFTRVESSYDAVYSVLLRIHPIG